MPFSSTGKILVNQFTLGSQQNFGIAALEDGNHVITYVDSDNPSTVKGRLVNLAGTPIGDEFIIRSAGEMSGTIHVTGLTNGHFVAVWDARSELIARIFDANGNPVSEQIVVARTTSIFGFAGLDVSAKQDGGFGVSWMGSEVAFADQLSKVRVYDAVGSPVSDVIVVHPDLDLHKYPGLPNIAYSADGTFLATWSQLANDVGLAGTDVYGQIYDTSGMAITSAFVINSENGMDDQSSHSFSLPNGNWLVSWESEAANSFLQPFSINYKIVDTQGNAVSPASTLVTLDNHSTYNFYQLHILADGRFLLFYKASGSWGVTINAQVFQSDGTSCGDSISIDAGRVFSSGDPGITALQDGNFAVTWSGQEVWTSSDTDIYSTVIKLTRFEGTDSGDQWKGGSFAEVMTGRGGNDTFFGNGGEDVLSGGNGDDRLLGGDGSDRITGGTGTDQINGGLNSDLITGGLGKDTILGGNGGDVFDFNSAKESSSGRSRDVIRDFQHLVDDIDLRSIDASVVASGNNQFRFIGSTAFSKLAGELRFSKINQGGLANDKMIIEGDLNGDAVADFQIELTGIKILSAADFFL